MINTRKIPNKNVIFYTQIQFYTNMLIQYNFIVYNT